MDFLANLFLFSMFWKLSTGIKCYRCEPEQSVYEPQNQLCSNFDYSDSFITDCVYSTVCVKKVISLTFDNGETVSSVRRGCATQLVSGDQEKKDGKWHPVKKIYEEYKAGCSEPTDPDKVTQTTLCFCRGSLCNTAPSIFANVLGTTIITGIILNILG